MCLALVCRLIGARIETRLEQAQDVGGDGRVLDQRRPHIVLGIGHADLPQKARNGADQSHVAPHHPRRQHERVVTVVLGTAAHHHQEGRLEALLDGLEVDRTPVGALEQHVVEPDVGFAFGVVRDVASDLIGTLVHDLEAHILEHGHALGQGNWPLRSSISSIQRRCRDPRRDGESRRPVAGPATSPP